jgi:acyl-coenzyme A thioesterase 9
MLILLCSKGRAAKENVALVANFTFVARDSDTKKAAPVNPLVPETGEEKRLYEEAEARNELRKWQRKQGNTDASKEAVDKQRLKDILSEVGGKPI